MYNTCLSHEVLKHSLEHVHLRCSLHNKLISQNVGVSDGDAKGGKVKGESGKEEEEEVGDGKTAAFTVLLHGSLKVESMVALVQLA